MYFQLVYKLFFFYGLVEGRELTASLDAKVEAIIEEGEVIINRDFCVLNESL